MGAAGVAAAEQLTSEVAAKEDFWAALDVILGQSLGENDAACVRRAFAKVGGLCVGLFCKVGWDGMGRCVCAGGWVG